jgi:hypothetical protein
VQLFHGDADTLIRFPNHTEAIKQWTNIHGLSTTPSQTRMGVQLGNHQATRQRWESSCGTVVLDAFASIGGDHGPSDALFLAEYVVPFLERRELGRNERRLGVGRYGGEQRRHGEWCGVRRGRLDGRAAARSAGKRERLCLHRSPRRDASLLSRCARARPAGVGARPSARPFARLSQANERAPPGPTGSGRGRSRSQTRPDNGPVQ